MTEQPGARAAWRQSIAAACLAALASSLGAQTPSYHEDRRFYDLLIEQNKAQAVILTGQGLVTPELGRRMAQALDKVHRHNVGPGGKPSANYLVLEKQLMDVMGPEASNLHLGRSRNDLGATSERMVLRREVLRILGRMADARAALLDLAEANVNTVVPGYTHAVQAQPATLAHYLGAFASALERDEERITAAYARINRCPLGAGAFTTSGFGLDRRRLMELLGFEGLVENAYDAIMVSTVDSKAEISAALALSAVNIGRFAQQFLIQYSDPRPGINLDDRAVGHSSIMPQKRNPSIVENVRMLASGVVGDANTVFLTAHNTPGGESGDIRMHLVYRALAVTGQASEMYGSFTTMLRNMRVDPEVTLAIVNADFSVMTEFADTLFREAGVPFRTGHKAASDLAAYGRAKGKTPASFTYEEVAEVYRKSAGSEIPLNRDQVRRAFDPREFVASRRGVGGPQPAEMNRMLAAHRARLAAANQWLAAEKERLAQASARLNAAFGKLVE